MICFCNCKSCFNVVTSCRKKFEKLLQKRKGSTLDLRKKRKEATSKVKHDTLLFLSSSCFIHLFKKKLTNRKFNTFNKSTRQSIFTIFVSYHKTFPCTCPPLIWIIWIILFVLKHPCKSHG